MNSSKIFLLFTMSIGMSFILSSYLMMSPIPVPMQIAMAQNDTTISTGSTSQQTNSSITLGNPIFIEHDKVTPLKPAVINNTQLLQASYEGNGVVKGVNFSASGTVLLVPRSNVSADLSGHAVITTTDGEKGTYTFYSIAHRDAAGITRDNGATFFNTTSSGKLSVINDLVVVFKEQIDKARIAMNVGWEWK